MARFDDANHYMQVFRDGGLDYLNLDEAGRPTKVSLSDYLVEGQKQLKGALSDISWRDAISTPDISPWLPQVIERVAMEAQEPLLVLNGLFERVGYEAGQVIEFPAMGAVTAADVAEGEAFPEVKIQESGATATAKVGKSGVAFRITEEARRHSRFDIVGMHLRACSRALARHKEQKAANFINALGTVCFDNVTPTSSLFGVTHGRGLTGAANGSVVLDDIFDTFAQVMMQGFTPDTIICHPLTFVLFLKDPVLRAVMLAGGNRVWYGGWTGNAARRGPGSRTGASGGQAIVPGGGPSSDTVSTIGAYNQTMDSAFEMPNHWPWPLKIVVSPFIPYDPATKRTNLIVADSAELGLYIEDYPVRVDRWEDLSTDTTKVKLVEAYAYHILNEGLGVGVLKNIKVVPNEITLPPTTTIAVSGSVDAIPAAVAV